MKFLIAKLGLAATAFLFSSAAIAAPCSAGFCQGQSGGQQCTLNNKVHTCGVCAGGAMLFVGDLSQSTANDRCGCAMDKTKPCNKVAAATQVEVPQLEVKKKK